MMAPWSPVDRILPANGLELRLFGPSQVSFTQARFARNGSTLPCKRVREKIQGILIYLRH